jgi:hypothetical protein
LTLLDNYEVWLRRLNGLTADVPLTLPSPSASTGDSSSMTAQLEERIQHLKLHLVLPLAAATPPTSTKSSSSQASAAAATSVPDATSGAAAAVDAARAAAAAAGVEGNGDKGNNMARWFQNVTPEDVAAMNGLTVESIASRCCPVTTWQQTCLLASTALSRLNRFEGVRCACARVCCACMLEPVH